jgi:hypothetical protein
MGLDRTVPLRALMADDDHPTVLGRPVQVLLVVRCDGQLWRRWWRLDGPPILGQTLDLLPGVVTPLRVVGVASARQGSPVVTVRMPRVAIHQLPQLVRGLHRRRWDPSPCQRAAPAAAVPVVLPCAGDRHLDLESLFEEVLAARVALEANRHRPVTPTATASVLDGRARLLASLEAFTGALSRYGLPLPWGIRDELRLYRRLRCLP